MLIRRLLITLLMASLLIAGVRGADPAPTAPLSDEDDDRAPVVRGWPDTKLGRMMKELQDFQNAQKTGEDEWARQMRAIIELGPEAVPELITFLDQTPRKDRRMMRSIPYLLRGIGDKRAIPALIRAIPRCFGRGESDFGMAAKDEELGGFMARNNNGLRKRPISAFPSKSYDYGRPIREVSGTLVQWTGVTNGWEEINFVFADDSTPQQLWRKQRAYHRCAERWATWWGEHWKEHVEDPAYAEVRLVPFTAEQVPDVHVNPSAALVESSSVGNLIIEPFQQKKARHAFYDLDTGRSAGLPAEWSGKPIDQLDAAEEPIAAWAADEGFDLMGVERKIEGQPRLLIRTTRIDAWQVPNEFWATPPSTGQQHIDAGRIVEKDLAPYDRGTGKSDPSATGVFFFITPDGTAGRFYLGVEVFDATMKPGGFAGGDTEHMRIGFYRGRRFGARLLAPQGPK
jgi:hypothetical protein